MTNTAATTPTTHVAESPTTAAPSLEHSKVVMKLKGSLSTFGEGSARRTAFVSGLAAVLRIYENQILLVSVTEGSVVVELGFVRLDGTHASPAEVILRLQRAAESGDLNQFELTELTIGYDTVLMSSSGNTSPANLDIIAAASVGGVTGAIFLAAVIWKLYKRGNKVSPDAERASELELGSYVDVPVPSLCLSPRFCAHAYAGAAFKPRQSFG